MSKLTHIAAALLTLAVLNPMVANAESAPAPLTYEQFEAAVSHVDLDECPQALLQENTFCRASIHHEQIHVFAFSYDGESPMVGFASFEAAGIASLLK